MITIRESMEQNKEEVFRMFTSVERAKAQMLHLLEDCKKDSTDCTRTLAIQKEADDARIFLQSASAALYKLNVMLNA